MWRSLTTAPSPPASTSAAAPPSGTSPSCQPRCRARCSRVGAGLWRCAVHAGGGLVLLGTLGGIRTEGLAARLPLMLRCAVCAVQELQDWGQLFEGTPFGRPFESAVDPFLEHLKEFIHGFERMAQGEGGSGRTASLCLFACCAQHQPGKGLTCFDAAFAVQGRAGSWAGKTTMRAAGLGSVTRSRLRCAAPSALTGASAAAAAGATATGPGAWRAAGGGGWRSAGARRAGSARSSWSGSAFSASWMASCASWKRMERRWGQRRAAVSALAACNPSCLAPPFVPPKPHTRLPHPVFCPAGVCPSPARGRGLGHPGWV